MYKARTLAAEFPWAPGAGDTQVLAFAERLQDAYQLALPVRFSVSTTFLGSPDYHFGGMGTVGTFHPWRAQLLTLDGQPPRRTEEEVHIVETLSKASADAHLTEVYVPTKPFGPISLPPILQDVAGLMALFADNTEASRAFLAEYRTAASVTCALENCGG